MNNSNLRKLNGFSLIELLIALAVIAVLVGITMVGLSILQRNGRDGQRVETANGIKIAVEKFYQRNGKYPTANEIYFENDKWIICLTPPGDPSCTDNIEVVAEEEHLRPGDDTTDESSFYCYYSGTDSAGGYDVDGTYILGIKRESNKWTELGTETTLTCGQVVDIDHYPEIVVIPGNFIGDIEI